MKKIIIAGLYNDKNLGDRVIAESYEFLARNHLKELHEVNFQHIDLAGLANSRRNNSFIKRRIRGGVSRLYKILRISSNQKEVTDQFEYFDPLVQGASSIVLVGGD